MSLGRSQAPAGFTLVEVLVATALAALLMVAVLNVTVSLGRTQKAWEHQQRQQLPAWQSQLLELLRRDLTHARELEVKTGRLTLTTFGAIDPKHLTPRHRPVQVVYAIKQVDQTMWLVREQTPLDQFDSPAVWVELLGCGIKGFSFAKAARSSKAATSPDAGVAASENLLSDGCLGLAVTWTDPTQAPWETLVRWRE